MFSSRLTSSEAASAVSAAAVTLRNVLIRQNTKSSHKIRTQIGAPLSNHSSLLSSTCSSFLSSSCASSSSLLSSSFHSSVSQCGNHSVSASQSQSQSQSQSLSTSGTPAGVRRWQLLSQSSIPPVFSQFVSSSSTYHSLSLRPSQLRALLSLLSDPAVQRFFSTATASTNSNPSSHTSPAPDSSAETTKASSSSSSSASSSSSSSSTAEKSSEEKQYEQAAQDEAEYQASHQSEVPRAWWQSLGRFLLWCVALGVLGYGAYEGIMLSLPWIIGRHAHEPQKHSAIFLWFLMMACNNDTYRLRLLQNDDCVNALLTLLEYHMPAPGPDGFLYSDIANVVCFKFASEMNTRDLFIQKVDNLLSYLFAAAYSNSRLGPMHALLAIKFLLASKDPKIIKEFEEKKGLLLLMRLGKNPNNPTANPAMECILTLFDNHLVGDLRPMYNAYPQDRDAIIFAVANIGTLYLERKQYDQAVYALSEALKLHEKNSAIRTHYGSALWAHADRKNDSKMKEEAIRQFRLALKNDPGQLDAAYHLSYALLAQVGVKFSTERTEFAQEKKAHTKDEEAKIDATFKEVTQVLQHALTVAKEIAKEYEIQEKAKQAPGGINLPPAPMGIHPMQLPAIPLICYLLIRAYHRSGRTSDAVKVATDWAINFHHQPIPHFILGRLALESGDSELALRELRKAYELDPERPEIAYKYGLALYKANRLEQAESKALEAIQNDRKQREKLSLSMSGSSSPKDSLNVVPSGKSSELRPLKLPRLLLARIYIRQNKFSEALTQLNRYLKTTNDSDILAQFLRAICIQQIDGLEKACNYFEQTMNDIEKIIDKKNGGSGLNKYLKENKKIAKKLLSIEEACKKATQKDKEEKTPFGSMCKKYEQLKLVR